MNLRFSLMLLPFLLLGCKTPKEQVEELRNQTQEKLTMSFFGNMCVGTYGQPKKIKKHMDKMIKTHSATEMTAAKLGAIRTADDAGIYGWEIVNALNGGTYILTISRRHVCSLTSLGMDKDRLHAEFDTLSTHISQDPKIHITRKTGPEIAIQNYDTYAYHIALEGKTVGPQITLALSQTRKQNDVLIFYPATNP